jgi:tetratricopeptide (TPR) repeat protein
MRQFTFVFLIISVLFSSTAISETADEWLKKADELSDGQKYTDPLKAVEYLNKALTLQPHDAETYYNRGVAYDNLGQYKQAIKDYDQAIRLKSDYAEAFYNRGIVNNNIGQYQRAVEDFKEAIRLNPEDVEAYLGLGFACDKLYQYQLAIESYGKAIGLQPDYAKAYNNRGSAYFSQGNNRDGCYDAQKACILGNCKLLKTAKEKGICR